MYKFINDLKEEQVPWYILSQQVAGLPSVIKGESETDGVKYVSLEFEGYGEIPNIPLELLEEVNE